MTLCAACWEEAEKKGPGRVAEVYEELVKEKEDMLKGIRDCRDGEPISKTHWHKTWRKAASRADRGHLLFHDLRRSVVRRMELAGVPRKTAMAWVGHKTEAVYNRYAIHDERDLMPAAEKMLRAMRPASELRVVPFQKR